MSQQTPAFDYERALHRLGGDAELFREIVVMFLEDSPGLLAALRQALSINDSPLAERSAHSIKGTSTNFEALSTSAAAALLEHHARDRNWQLAADCLPALEEELARLRSALEEFCGA